MASISKFPRIESNAMTRRIGAALSAVAVAIAAFAITAPAASASDGWTDVDEHGEYVHPIVFPVDGDNFYTDTWLAPRGSGRRHLGTDLMADKLVPILAADSGCVTGLRHGGVGGGNMLTITANDGWQYRYIHINNDSPGTDDGANPYEWAFTVNDGDCVEAGQHIAYVGDSGNAESTGAHLHFEMIRPDGIWINPYFSVKAAEGGALPPTACSGVDSNPARTPSEASARGYWLVDSVGRVHAYDAPHLGDLTTIGVDTPAASMTATESGEGYWIVDVDGVVHAFGDAGFHGDMRGWTLNGPVRRIEPHPNGNGYWLVADDGGVFTFGAAHFLGSLGDRRLNAPIISMAASATGDGYWLVGSDGGVFTFGAAGFHGSTGDLRLNKPVIDMAVPPSGDGYWLYASDGGVFTFGSLAFHGSIPGLDRCDIAPSVALRPTDTGDGYWIVTTTGEVLAFGDALHRGGQPDLHYDDPNNPDAHHHAVIVDMAIRHH